MSSRILRAITALDTEERIINGSAIVAAVGVFLPWLSGEWLGGDYYAYSGASFYTSFLGTAVLLLNIAILSITIGHIAMGKPLLKRDVKEVVRFFCSVQSTIFVLAALSVLTKVTFDFSRMEVRFGIYVSLTGSLVASIYTFLRWQEQRRNAVKSFFHHPEDVSHPAEKEERTTPSAPPPPPPPPLKAEQHGMNTWTPKKTSDSSIPRK